MYAIARAGNITRDIATVNFESGYQEGHLGKWKIKLGRILQGKMKEEVISRKPRGLLWGGMKSKNTSNKQGCGDSWWIIKREVES